MLLRKLRRIRQQHEFERLYARLSPAQRDLLQTQLSWWLSQRQPREWKMLSAPIFSQ